MIWEKMRKELDSLPRAQKNVARYMIENPSEVIFMTSQQLGVNSGTSEATVIRLASTLGFQGFPEFKEALQFEAKDRLSTFGRFQQHRSMTHADNLLADVISGEMAQAAGQIERADDRQIAGLANLICTSSAICILGLRSAKSLAYYMQFYLSWFLPNIYAPEIDYFENYLVSAPKDSLVIGISFPRYTRLTVDYIAMAKKKGVRTAAITDSLSSPLAIVSDHAVITPCIHVAHIDSLMVPFGMANAVLIEVAKQLGMAGLSRLSDLEKVWADGSIYY